MAQSFIVPKHLLLKPVEIRRELKKTLKEWEAVSKKLVSGIVLDVGTGNLLRSFVRDISELYGTGKGGVAAGAAMFGSRSSIKAQFKMGKAATIILRNTARDARGFSYPAYHEYYTGRAFLRPALLKIMNTTTRHKYLDSFAEDAVRQWQKTMLEFGWRKAGARLMTKEATVDLRTHPVAFAGYGEFSLQRTFLGGSLAQLVADDEAFAGTGLSPRDFYPF